MNRTEYTTPDPLKIPPQHRQKLISQVLRGEVNRADFPDLFPPDETIFVRLPEPTPEEQNYFRRDPVTGIYEHKHQQE